MNIIDMSQCPEETPVQVYNPDGTLLLETTHVYKFNWVRWQIAKNQLEGYTAVYKGKTYPLNKYGVSINNDSSEILNLEFEFAMNAMKDSIKAKRAEKQNNDDIAGKLN